MVSETVKIVFIRDSREALRARLHFECTIVAVDIRIGGVHAL